MDDINWTGVTEVCVGWNSHSSTLLSMFETYHEEGRFLDMKLVAEGQQIEVHSLALMCSSPLLKDLISQQLEKPDAVFLPDIPFSDLQAIVQLIYKGEVNLPENRVDSFLETTRFLQIGDIQMIKQELTAPPESDSSDSQSEASFKTSNSFQEDDFVGVTPDAVNDQDRDVDEDDMSGDSLIGEMDETEIDAGGEDDSSALNPSSPLELVLEEPIQVQLTNDQDDDRLPQEEAPQAEAEVEDMDVLLPAVIPLSGDRQPQKKPLRRKQIYDFTKNKVVVLGKPSDRPATGDEDVVALPAFPGQTGQPAIKAATKEKKAKRRRIKYRCIICNLSFRKQLTLRGHLKKIHRIKKSRRLDILTTPDA